MFSRPAFRSSAIALAALVALPVFAWSSPAAADLRVCNKTMSSIGVAIGYRADDDWTTEGWWNLPADACATLISGPLTSRYFYIYAVDYDLGGDWHGSSFMCTSPTEFTIRGIGDCVARGYDRTGFFEVDVGGDQNHTIQLDP